VYGRTFRTIAGLTLLLIAALVGWTVVDAAQVTATADQLAEAQQMILSLTDSVRSLVAPDAATAVQPDSQHSAKPFGHAKRTSMAGVATPAPGVVLPVIGRITSRFARSRFHPLLNIFRPHRGVDVSAPLGSNITAPAAGRVKFVGRRLGDGLMVELDHGAGVVTRYAHCRTTLVQAGDQVTAGTVIATVGRSGLATGPHVHFEVIVRGHPVDPLKYLVSSHDPGTVFVPVVVDKAGGQH
jgi:murein DD-endopeptidase MepM/ murein hydrolase activator NlpD